MQTILSSCLNFFKPFDRLLVVGLKSPFGHLINNHFSKGFENSGSRIVHCRKKIGDVLIVYEQVKLMCKYLDIRIPQFVAYSRVRNRRRAGNKCRAWKICQKE